jgi:hypothetical protein
LKEKENKEAINKSKRIAFQNASKALRKFNYVKFHTIFQTWKKITFLIKQHYLYEMAKIISTKIKTKFFKLIISTFDYTFKRKCSHKVVCHIINSAYSIRSRIIEKFHIMEKSSKYKILKSMFKLFSKNITQNYYDIKRRTEMLEKVYNK